MLTIDVQNNGPWHVVPEPHAFLPTAKSFMLPVDHTGLVALALLPQETQNKSIELSMSAQFGATAPLSTVLGGLEPIFKAAEDFERNLVRIPRNIFARGRGLRVLSLDGGGVRGLFSVLVLEELMQCLGRMETPNAAEAPKP